MVSTFGFSEVTSVCGAELGGSGKMIEKLEDDGRLPYCLEVCLVIRKVIEVPEKLQTSRS